MGSLGWLGLERLNRLAASKVEAIDIVRWDFVQGYCDCVRLFCNCLYAEYYNRYTI